MWSNGGERDGRKGRDWIPVALNAVVRQSVGGVAAHHDGHPLQRRREVMALQDLRTTDKSNRSCQNQRTKKKKEGKKPDLDLRVLTAGRLLLGQMDLVVQLLDFPLQIP